MSSELSQNQLAQEEQNAFPYHYLDLAIDEYRLLFKIEYRQYLNTVQQLMPLAGNRRVLDAGCGDGRFCYELRKAQPGFEIMGVDYSDQAIAFAKAFNPGIPFFVQDLTALDVPGRFAYIVLIETLEHIIPEQIPKVLSQLSERLEPGGKLIVTVPASTIPVAKKHYQHFSSASLRQALEPFFEVNQVVGHSKLGWRYKIFVNLRRLGILLYPLHALALIDRYLRFVGNYYARHLKSGPPDRSRGLIAVATKRA